MKNENKNGKKHEDFTVHPDVAKKMAGKMTVGAIMALLPDGIQKDALASILTIMIVKYEIPADKAVSMLMDIMQELTKMQEGKTNGD